MTDLLLGIIAVLFGTVAYFTKKIMDDTKNIQKELKPVTPAIIEIQNKFTTGGHTIMFPPNSDSWKPTQANGVWAKGIKR